MKKILFCAAIAAIATACTEDELIANHGDSQSLNEGLVFEASLEEGADSRGELYKDENGMYPFFWYAEQDRINVWANNLKSTVDGVYDDNAAGKGRTQFTGSITGITPAVYKATKSEGKGQFTAVSDKDMLVLQTITDADNALARANKTATIIATYGDITATKAVSKNATYNGVSAPVPGELTEFVIKTTAGGTNQTVARPNQINAPMYSISQASRNEDYSSLGEKANLKMIRPFPVVKFTTKNTADYISYFGKLNKVHLRSLGAKVNGVVKEQLYSMANNVEYTVIGTSTGFATAPGLSKSVYVTVQDGTWTDDDAVYMNIAPVNRSIYREEGVKEAFMMEYEFDNIKFTLDPTRPNASDFEKLLMTDNNWTAVDKYGNPNAVTALPALDINNYNYLVTNGPSRTLIVINGNFSDIYNANKTHVVWNGVNVALSEFQTIVSNVALSDTEMQSLSNFSSLKNLILKSQTTVPAGTFAATQGSTIEKIEMPYVTSVSRGFIKSNGAFAGLKELYMGSYEFEDEVVNEAFFNNNTASTLQKLDMSGVRSMLPKFGILRTLVFENYGELNYVKVQDGMIVSPNGFENCVKLAKVDGIVNIEEAPDAFRMSTANTVLTSVDLSSTIIPNYAFYRCASLASVNYYGSPITPSEIGERAFAGAAALKYLDLSWARTIGAAAFKNSSIKSNNSSTNILTVGATILNDEVFADNDDLVMIKFTDATLIAGNNILNNTSALRQVKFNQVVSLQNLEDGTYASTMFGTNTKKIDFWTSPYQTGVNGVDFTLGYKSGTNSKNIKFTFKSIQKKID